MTKNIKKLTGMLLTFMFLCSLISIDAFAAGGLSMSSSASKVEEGGTFTVTVTADNDYFVAGINLNVSGGSVVSGLGKTSLDSGESTSATIKLTGESCKVSVSGTAANYTTETEGTASASVTVSKKAPAASTNKEETKPEEPKSGNNNLASLSVSGGSLVPVFHADTTSYKVSLSAETTSATITAKASDAKATVSGIGDKTLMAGDNIFEVVCTAENGKTKTYTVNLYVDETPFVYADYKGEQLGVVRNQEGIGLPETFEETTVTLSEQSVQAYQSNQYNTTILYMVDSSGEKNFYMYDEENGITSVFRPVSFLGRNVVIYDLTEEEQIRENMTYQEVTVDGIQMKGWIYTTPGYENFVHIPVMNEFGEKVIYQHETTENSLQLYKEYVAPVVEEEEETKTITFDLMYLYIAIGVVGLLLLILLILVVKYNKLKKYSRMI